MATNFTIMKHDKKLLIIDNKEVLTKYNYLVQLTYFNNKSRDTTSL